MDKTQRIGLLWLLLWGVSGLCLAAIGFFVVEKKKYDALWFAPVFVLTFVFAIFKLFKGPEA